MNSRIFQIEVVLPTKEEILEIEKQTGMNLLGIESALVRDCAALIHERLNQIMDAPDPDSGR